MTDAKRGAPAPAHTPSLPKMSLGHSLGFWLRVALPTWSKGIIVRRPAMVAVAERLGLDAKAVRYMERLHAAYGGRSVLVRNPFRPQVVVIDPDDVRAVLEATPEPFTPASDEKRAALAHFEPSSSLVSDGFKRTPRRLLNEQALETAAPVHNHADRFQAVVREEMGRLLDETTSELTWPAFSDAWFTMVRRFVLGDRAQKDDTVTDLMVRLRSRANWAFMLPKNRHAQKELHQRLQTYVDSAEPGSLAALLAGAPQKHAAATHQMTQWLFPFDPAGMTTFRALALIVSHAGTRGRHLATTCLQHVQNAADHSAIIGPARPAGSSEGAAREIAQSIPARQIGGDGQYISRGETPQSGITPTG